MIFKGFAGGLALIPLFEAAELQRIMLTAGADIIRDEVIMSDLVPLLGMVPEPADIFDELPVVGDEHVINGDHSVVAVSRVGRLLQPLQSPLVQLRDIPVSGGEEAIQTRLVRRHGELAVDSRHTFPLSDHQSGQVLAEVSSLRFAHKQIRKFTHGFLNYLRQFNNPWHDSTLPGRRAPSKIQPI